jgi:hypothetical protein
MMTEMVVVAANDTVQENKKTVTPRVLPVQFDAFYGPFITEVFSIQTLVRQEVYTTFFEQFGAFIIHLIAKRNKVTRNSREIVQELFTQLQEAHLIEKFFDQARDSVPETMTAAQAFRVCGVKWDAFRYALWTFRVGSPVGEEPRDRFRKSGGRPEVTRKKTQWMPTPVSGGVQSLKAVYRTEDILRLSEMGYFKKVGVKEMPYPKPTRKHFQHYLSVAVNNRFKNFCRGEERHHKERVWDTFSELRPAVDDPTPWENRLPDLGACNQEASAELSLLISKIEKSPAKALKNELFELLGDGYDLEVAIDKLTLSSEDKRTTKLRVSHWIKQIQERKAEMAQRKQEQVIVQTFATH